MKVSARLRGSGWVAWHMHDTRLSMPPPPLAASLAALAALAASGGLGGLWRPRCRPRRPCVSPWRPHCSVAASGGLARIWRSRPVRPLGGLLQVSRPRVTTVSQSVSQFSLSAPSVRSVQFSQSVSQSVSSVYLPPQSDQFSSVRHIHICEGGRLAGLRHGGVLGDSAIPGMRVISGTSI